MSTTANTTADDVELDPSIAERLAHFGRRRARLITVRSGCAAIVALLTTMSLVAICDQIWILGQPTRWLLSLVAYAATAMTLARVGWPGRERHDLRKIARQFESADGRLREELISAVELSDPDAANGSASFRQALQQRVGRRIATINVDQLLPFGLVRPWLWTMAAALLVAGILSVIPQIQFSRRIVRAMLPMLPVQRASLTRIEILQPAPPSGSVAAGDAVGIVATITNLDDSRASLEYQVADGSITSSTMIRRSESSNFAAILPIRNQPVRYRVLAGDAVTLWHRLTPIERPHTQTFTIRYQFPDYARLDDEVVVQDDGRLEGVVGTIAHLQVGFTEACRTADVRYFGRPRSLAMKPTDKSLESYSIALPIQQPIRYQIEAVSAESDLRSPLVEPYEISASIDGPPTVRFENAPSRRRLISVIDSVPINAIIKDEFPVDRVFLEFQVNDGPAHRVDQELLAPDAHLKLNLAIDLLDLRSLQGEPIAVAPGDIVQLQLVAIDRKGLRGDSAIQQWLIANDGLDPNRYTGTQQLGNLTEQVIAWSQALTVSLETAEQPVPSVDKMIDALISTLVATDSRSAAGRLELIADAMISLHDEAQSLADSGNPLEQDRKRLSKLAQQVEQYARANFSHHLNLVLIDDAMAIHQSIERFCESESAFDRQVRFLQIMNQQLTDMDGLIEASMKSLLKPVTKALEKWTGWRANHVAQIAPLADAADGETTSLLPIIDDFARQMNAAKTGRSFPSQTAYLELTRGHRELSRKMDSIAHEIRTHSNMTKPDGGWSDSFQAKIDSIKRIHAAHPAVDLPYTADLGLLRRAIGRIADPQTTPIENESKSDSLLNVADAFAVLQVTHELIQSRLELRQLVDLEQDHESTAGFWFDHPQRFSRYLVGISNAEAKLRNLPLAQWKLPAKVHGNSAVVIERVVDRLNQREIDLGRLVSVHRQTRRLADELSDYINSLQPLTDRARITLRRYAIPLSQTAQLAAEKVDIAIDRVRSDSSGNDNKQEVIANAGQATEKTMQALIDLANSLAHGDESSRQLARDADSALSQISRQLGRSRDANQASASPEQLAAELDALKNRLAETAEHFRRSETGEDLADSREKLRAGEANEQLTQQLNDRAQQEESLRAAAERDAEALRKQLEREAEENEMMRDALSEIARKTAASALDSLRQSAEDERNLARQLEQSDPVLAELKYRSSNEIAAIMDHIATLSRVLGSALEKSLATPKSPLENTSLAEWREAIQKAREAGSLVNQPEILQSTLDKAVREMIQQIARSRESARSIDFLRNTDPTEDQANQRLAADRRHAESVLRDVRDQLVRAAADQKRDWTKAKQSASDRVSRAKQRIRQETQRDSNSSDQTESRSGHAALSQSAAETSVEHAKQMIAEATQRADRLRNQAIDTLEADNPYAETIQRLIVQLDEQLGVDLESLQEIQTQIASANPANIPKHVYANLRNDQQIIRDEIDETGNELRRAALNEQRLGRDAAAERLANAATRIKRVASSLADAAAKKLERGEIASENSASAARDKVVETETGIRHEVDQLSALLGQIDTDDSSGKERKPEGAESARGEQLAKTLDELDQARSQENRSESNQTAGDASPTLQEAAEQASREAAKQRSDQMAAGSQQHNAEKPPPESAADNAFSGSGSMGDTDQRPMSIDDVDREGSDWGKLQVRRGDNAARTRRAGVPAKYRHQIDAYFRAIAEQSESTNP